MFRIDTIMATVSNSSKRIISALTLSLLLHAVLLTILITRFHSVTPSHGAPLRFALVSVLESTSVLKPPSPVDSTPVAPPTQLPPEIPNESLPPPPEIKPAELPPVHLPQQTKRDHKKPVAKPKQVTNRKKPIETTSPQESTLESFAQNTQVATPSDPIAAIMPTAVPDMVPSYRPPDIHATYANNPKPIYPPSAQRLGQEGVALLTVEVTEMGRVARVEVQTSSGYESLDRAAMEAVSRWHFAPARRNGIAQSATVTVPVRFNLQ